jgi:putative SOS response-associated peptidase YedK
VRASGELFAFAGPWKLWKDPWGEAVDSWCIITCEPNDLTAKFHDRKPVIIAPEDHETWLTGTPGHALALLRPYPAEQMQVYPVNAKVNRPANDTRESFDPFPE